MTMQKIKEDFSIYEIWETPEKELYTVYIDEAGTAFVMDDKGTLFGHGNVSRREDTNLYSATTWENFLMVCDGMRLMGKHIDGNPYHFAE